MNLKQATDKHVHFATCSKEGMTGWLRIPKREQFIHTWNSGWSSNTSNWNPIWLQVEKNVLSGKLRTFIFIVVAKQQTKIHLNVCIIKLRTFTDLQCSFRQPATYDLNWWCDYYRNFSSHIDIMQCWIQWETDNEWWRETCGKGSSKSFFKALLPNLFQRRELHLVGAYSQIS